MDILMITSEAMPFASTGNLAEAVTSLSSCLVDKGHNVKIIMPRYYGISKDILTIFDDNFIFSNTINDIKGAIYKSSIKTKNNNNLEFYFLDYENYYGREGIYGSVDEPNFNDNPQRFSLLCHSAFQLCKKLNWYPNIMHSHDWCSALVPVILKYYEKDNHFSNTKSVFTIHNLGYQGIYSKHLFPTTGIEWKHYYSAGFEDYDNMNLLKAGIQSTDIITTVSPTYAKEILTRQLGFRIEPLLKHRQNDLYGILNGIDTDKWNPETDKFILQNYTKNTIQKKFINKIDFQKKMGLEVNADIPLIGFTSKFIEQKGINELFGPSFGCVPAICTDMKIQFVVLGSGESWCENELRNYESKLPNFKSYIGYNEEIEHQLIASCDFVVMPSVYEPSGELQMCCQRYGTLPILRNTGGFADTVENYNEKLGTGTGFLFNDLTPQSVYDTVGWAVFAWYNKSHHIEQMIKRVMAKDFSWENSALEYQNIYQK